MPCDVRMGAARGDLVSSHLLSSLLSLLVLLSSWSARGLRSTRGAYVALGYALLSLELMVVLVLQLADDSSLHPPEWLKRRILIDVTHCRHLVLSTGRARAAARDPARAHDARLPREPRAEPAARRRGRSAPVVCSAMT